MRRQPPRLILGGGRAAAAASALAADARFVRRTPPACEGLGGHMLQSGPECQMLVPPRQALMLRRAPIVALLVLQLAVTGGCTAWSRTASPGLPDPVPQEVQVWALDSITVVKDPAIRNDSLIGSSPSTADGETLSRRGWPLVGIDSLRVRKVSPTRTVLAAIGIVGAVAFVAAVSGGAYGDQP